MLYHLTTTDAWEAALQLGHYEPPSLAAEGFIHLSTESQWPETQARFFKNVPKVLLLTIDSEKLTAEVILEDLYGHGAFPHLYGILNLGAVVSVDLL
jgi:uncharacterized protein (DUF952 family)